VINAEGEAKFWVRPEVRVARSAGFDARTLSMLARIVTERAGEIEEAWHGHFG